MKEEVKNQIKSFKALADATMNPVLIASYLYVKRTGNTLTLDGVGLEMLNNEGLTQ